MRGSLYALLWLALAPFSSAILGNQKRNPSNKRKIWPVLRTRIVGSRITALELVNTITNAKVVNLVNGTVVATSSIRDMSTPSFSVTALVNGSDVKSVQFDLSRGNAGNSNITRHVENKPPYTLCGSRGRNIARCANLGFGSYTLIATPFPRKRARGEPGRLVSIRFTIAATPSEGLLPTKAPLLQPRGVTTPPVKTPVASPTVPSPTVPTRRDEFPTRAPADDDKMAPSTSTETPTFASTDHPTSAPSILRSTPQAAPVRKPTVPTRVPVAVVTPTRAPMAVLVPVTPPTSVLAPTKPTVAPMQALTVPDAPRTIAVVPVTVPSQIAPSTQSPIAIPAPMASPQSAPRVKAPTTWKRPKAPIQAPVAPLTQAPVTLAPMKRTSAPVTKAPVSKAPVAKTPVTKTPVTKTPVTKAPVFKAPVAKAPVTKAPVVKAPVANAPVSKAPMAKAPVSKAPVLKAPVVNVPVVKGPVTKAPAIKAPLAKTKSPVAKAPAANAPMNMAPTRPPVNPSMAGISHLELINVNVKPNKVVTTLLLRSVNIVNLRLLGLSKQSKFNVNVVHNSTVVQSVAFSNGHSETTLPWSYCGHNGPEYFPCSDLVANKTVNISIVPYPKRFQRGTPFPRLWSVVRIIEGAAQGPVPAPVRAPVLAPSAPRKVPLEAPRAGAGAPVSAPRARVSVTPPMPKGPKRCSIPKLLGNWKDRPVPHFPVAEAQGAMIGTTMVLVGGFRVGYETVSTQTHTFDTTNASAVWERQDDYPFATGVTHSAAVVVRNRFFMCGGYAGGGIGRHTDVCMVYNASQPRGKQWSTFARLPDGGRGGGGMVYDSQLRALIFSAGASRATSSFRSAIDHSNTWLYSLSNPSAGWVAKAPMPFFANHMSSVTAMDASGKERHYFSGGQEQEDEHDGNQAEHFEYDAVNDTWLARKFMPIPRGHAASSTRAIGCGFIMVAGCTNKGERLSDISYYDVPTDTWTKIGDLSVPMNTPVCDVSNGVLYCDTGWDSGVYSTQIGFAI